MANANNPSATTSARTEHQKRFKYEGWMFDDFAEFLQEIERAPEGEERRLADAMGNSSHKTDDPEWSGTASWDEALTLVQEGWADGLADFQHNIGEMSPYVMAAVGVRGQDLAPAGYLPDVPSFCAGSPACMYTEGDQFLARTPVLRMLVNIGGLAHVSAESWIMRGAAICSVIDYFEQIGIRVEIELISCAENREYRARKSSMVEVIVPVKRADEHIDMDRLAFVLGNAAMLRRFVFSLREKSTQAPLGGGYGASRDAEADPDQIYFPKMRNFGSPEEALKHVLQRVMEYLDPELQARVSDDWAEILPAGSRAARY